jgi:thiamine pyrophosphate-dependent acetolactate synthase large subunit-like protein
LCLFVGAGVRGAHNDDLSRIGRRTPVDVAVQGDVRGTINALLPHLTEKEDRRFLEPILYCIKKY